MKHVGGIIAAPLADIINSSFEQGVYPDLLKIAKIIPLYKNKGEKTDPSCYRPIAILSCFSKVIGKILSLRLISFFEQNNLLYKHQHGFTKKKGTATALFELVNRIHDALQEGQKCMGIFYDFSKAFDSISHDILLKKFERYGVVGVPQNLLRCFLSGRTQMVCLNYLDGDEIKTLPGKL
jgi:Reverse transcriptase (RNA-dependent DNA polymerase)